MSKKNRIAHAFAGCVRRQQRRFLEADDGLRPVRDIVYLACILSVLRLAYGIDPIAIGEALC